MLRLQLARAVLVLLAVTALNSNDRNFIAVGLSLTNVSYKGLMSGIIGASSTNATTASTSSPPP